MQDHARKLHPQLCHDLTHGLVSTNRCLTGIQVSAVAIMPQSPRSAIHSLLDGNDVMNYEHESLYKAKVVWMILARKLSSW